MHRLILPCALVLTLGCGGDDGGGDGSGTSSDSATSDASAGTDSGSGGSTSGGGGNLPDGDSQEAIAAFLDGGGYKGDGWTAHSPTPTDGINPNSPHGRFIAYFNDALVASVAAGNSEPDMPHDANSMAVKELYDAADALVGLSAMLKTTGPEWTYYCWGPAERCYTGSAEITKDAPEYGKDLDAISCHACHAGNVFTPIP